MFFLLFFAIEHADISCMGKMIGRVTRFHTDNMKKTNDAIRLTSKRNHLYPGHARKISEAILTYANKACPLGQYPSC